MSSPHHPTNNMKIALIYADRLEMTDLYRLRDQRLNDILNAIQSTGAETTVISRNQLTDSLDSYDLVVAAGGDGTQLDAASRLNHTPLCCIRLFPEKSVGYHCIADYTEIAQIIDNYQRNHIQIREIPRLQAVIDDIPCPQPILNDVLLANACPARASRYEIKFNERIENHCSSGVWISTQPGSHGAIKAAGGPVLDENEIEKAAFYVRECPSATIRCGIIHPGKDRLAFTCMSNELGIYFDGDLSSCMLKCGQTLAFRPHPSPLKKLCR